MSSIQACQRAQAEVKRERETATDPSSLVATGLAARPPEGLEEVKAVAQAAQEAHCRGETLSPHELDTPATSTPPTAPPRTVAEVRQALRGSNVLVYECHRQEDSSTLAEDSASVSLDRQRLVDELVEAYAARLRRVLSCSGRKPFRLAGLRLYADLLALLGSLETSLTTYPTSHA